MSNPSRPEPVKCVAHKRNGERCEKYPIRGATVCRFHGGAAKQVRRAAKQRILEAADMAAANLIKWMNDSKVPYPVRLAAARDLLDRADVTGKQEIEVTLKPWEQLLSGISRDLPSSEEDVDVVDAEVVHDLGERAPNAIEPAPDPSEPAPDPYFTLGVDPPPPVVESPPSPSGRRAWRDVPD